MSDVVVNVSLDDEGQQDPDACVQRLEALGLRRVAVRRFVGVVTGEVAESSLDHLRRAPGVRAVDVDRPVWALSTGPSGRGEDDGPGDMDHS